MIDKIHNKVGFTLVEILVAIAIAVIVMAGIYSAYHSQQKAYIAQGEVTAMQQNIRSAMYFMEREIRMAGCDPLGTAGAGIMDLGWDAGRNRYTSIHFTEDITDNAGTGDPDGDTADAHENITYTLNGTDLKRNGQTIAQNIEALDFVYLDAGGNPSADMNTIRSVQITLIARTGRGDPGFTDTKTYANQRGTPFEDYPAQDNFRRRRCTTQVKCRNLGL